MEKIDPFKLFNALNMLSVYLGKVIQHNATGKKYVITKFLFQERDMTIHFVYDVDVVSFSRPLMELFDGRFSLVGNDHQHGSAGIPMEFRQNPTS